MNLEAAKDRFEGRHPAHADPTNRGEPFDIDIIPSPTTEHIRVQCGCGHMERYTFAELGIPGKPDTRRRPAAG